MSTALNCVHAYRKRIVSCIILLLLTALIRTPLLSIPFERDEGEYAYIAWRIKYNELPYREWFDQKPPAIFWLNRLAFNLPMDPVRAIHLMALLFAAASACALFLLALRFVGFYYAFLAGVLFVLLSADPLLFGTEANTEMFMLLPSILSVLAFFETTSATRPDRHKFLFAVLAGIFVGMAIAFKQVCAVLWPFLVFMYPVFFTGQKRFFQTVIFALLLTVGISIVWGGIFFYFAARGALGSLIHCVFLYNIEYVHAVSLSTRLAFLKIALTKFSADEWFVWILCGVGLAWLLHTKRIKDFTLLLVWIVVSFIGISASGFYYLHYFQQWLPVLCLAAAVGLNALDQYIPLKIAPLFIRRLIALTVLVVPIIIVFYPYFFRYSPAEAVDKMYGIPFAEMNLLAHRLSQITKPKDKVYIFGAEPEILFYAQRVSATRYIFLDALYGPYSNAKKNQIIAADEITRNAPVATIYMPYPLFFSSDNELYLTKWTHAYIADNFRFDSCLMHGPNGFAIITNNPTTNGVNNWVGEIDINKTGKYLCPTNL